MQCRFGMMIPLSPRSVASVACRFAAHLQLEISASLRPEGGPDGQTGAQNWSKAATTGRSRGSTVGIRPLAAQPTGFRHLEKSRRTLSSRINAPDERTWRDYVHATNRASGSARTLADGSCFDKVMPAFQAEGDEVISAQCSLDTNEADVAATRYYLGQVSSSAILIGHSYGGGSSPPRASMTAAPAWSTSPPSARTPTRPPRACRTSSQDRPVRQD